MKTILSILSILTIFCTFRINAQSNFIGSGITSNFDGTTGTEVDLGDVYNDINFPITIEAWVYPTSWNPSGDYSPIMATDNTLDGSYYGYWFRFNNLGRLIFEIGDGSGSGPGDRRGKVTTTSIALNKWTHVSVVATSATDLNFYFNGILQPNTSAGGSATNTSMVHFTYPAYLGHHQTSTGDHKFDGSIDEVRLWTYSRSQSELRDHMCSKLSGTEDGLLGYWNFDESYVSSDVMDITTPSENGVIMGGVTKSTSGAPIGNVSINQYLADWEGVKMKLDSENDDYLRIKKIMNNPLGMHLYRVDSEPYYNDGLTNSTDYYFGIFPIDGVTPVEYGIAYKFSGSNGVTTVENRLQSTLFAKNNGSVETWSDHEAVIDLVQNFIRKTGNTTRLELIFNIAEPLVDPGEGDLKVKEDSEQISVFPNPTSSNIIIKNIPDNSIVRIGDIFGNIVLTEKIDSRIENYSVNITNLSAGTYLIYLESEGVVSTGKFVVTK